MEGAKENPKMAVKERRNRSPVLDKAAGHSHGILATGKVELCHEKRCHMPSPFSSGNSVTDNGTPCATRRLLYQNDTGTMGGTRAGSSVGNREKVPLKPGRRWDIHWHWDAANSCCGK